MKKTLALLLALAILLGLAACGQEAAPTAASETQAGGTEAHSADSAAPEQTGAESDGQTEDEEYTTESRRMLRRMIERAYEDPPYPSNYIVGLFLDRVTEYSYDEYGALTAETVSYRSPDEEGVYHDSFYTEDSEEWSDLQYEYDAEGTLIRVSGPWRHSPKCLVVTELSMGRPVKHSIFLDPEEYDGRNDLIVNYFFFYDAGGALVREETVQYFNAYLIPYDSPCRDELEFDATGHITHWHFEPAVSNGEPVGTAMDVLYEYDGGDAPSGVRVSEDGGSYESVPPEMERPPHYYSTHLEYAVIPVRIRAGAELFREVESLDSFYPILPVSCYGVPIPTPDGTQRLSAVVTQDSLLDRFAPVITKLEYDANGTLVGQTLRFGGAVPDEISTVDDMGRLIRVEYPDSDFLGEYIYAEDGLSYTSILTDTDREPRESVVRLEEYFFPEIVRLTPKDVLSESYFSEFFPGEDFEYTEEGLLASYPSAEGTVTLFYEVKFGQSGNLSRVDFGMGDQTYAPFTLYEFDEHGYLVFFHNYWSEYGISISFTYQYEQIS